MRLSAPCLTAARDPAPETKLALAFDRLVFKVTSRRKEHGAAGRGASR